MPVRSAVRTGSLRPFHLPKSLFALTVSTALLYSQDLAPRAYVITPTGSHAIILSSYFNRGDVLVDPTLPIEDGKGNFQVPSLSYYQSFSFLGLSSNLTIALPYAHGAFEGRVNNSLLQTHPSGLADARVRFSVNLNGGPAMKLGEYRKWTEKRLIGVSFTISAPTGQYDPARLINTGTNRWGFKPEIGFSRRWQHWVADWYFGAWLFTGNNSFYPGRRVRTQTPITAMEAHWGYYFQTSALDVARWKFLGRQPFNR